jgi:hypothetical protein
MMGYDAWGAGLPVEMYLDSCAASYKYKQGSFYVLEDEFGRLLSSCIVYPLAAFGGVVSERAVGLGSLATMASERHRGCATLFLAMLMKRLESEGVDAFFIHSDIPPKIYEKLGFAPAPQSCRGKAGPSIPMLRLSGNREVTSALWQNLVMPSYF